MRKKGLNFSLMLSAGVLLFGCAGAVTSCNSSQIVVPTIRLSKNVLELKVGEDAELKVQISKEFVEAQAYWVSTNENVVMVKKGHVFALGVGEAEVHVYIGGARDVCKVTVVEGEGGGGGGQTTTDPYLRLSPTSKTANPGSSFKITVNKYPTNGVVSFVSSETTVATVATDGTVNVSASATAGQSAVITATMPVEGADPLSATCTVTVAESGQTTEYDIGVDASFSGATGSFVIGSPTVYKDMTNSLLKKFNEYTNSNITWEIKDFEENTAATNLTPDASLGPDVFPYASDQTQGLNTLNALSRLGKNDKNWIKTNMGDAAYTAATLSTNIVGYPFASDNSYVMFYDKSKVSDPSEIDTLSKLFAKAASFQDARGRKFMVSYNLADGFYGGAALMSYTQGRSLYEYIPLSDGSYKSHSTFNSDDGLKGARALANIFKNNGGTLDSTVGYPTDSTRIIATITDCSKVLGMKQTMGSNYAVAPLPLNDYLADGTVTTDVTQMTRISSFSGYKFYGVNNKKLGNDTAKKDIANAIAKFLVSEYAQHVRLETFGIKPTMLSLQESAKSEPHVQALNEQETSKSAIPLSVVDSSFWAQTGNAVADIKTLAQAGAVSDEKLRAILADLDSTLLHNWD